MTQPSMRTEDSLGPGVLIGEKYRLTAICGSGSMGSVWSAKHVDLGHDVAIKFLHRWLEETRGGRERFGREARIAATLGEGSAQFPQVMDFAALDDGTPYIVMELLRGESLEARLQRSTTLELEEAVAITCQLCRAIQLAHDNGIVHRDLKPANVFLCDADDGPLVKVLDFGVARASTQNAYVTTQQGLLLGSPNYMSPERMIEGAPVDGRADLWAVAVMTYLMTVGEMPFGRHENVQDLCIAILQGEARTPSRIRPALPAAFDEWVRRALAKSIGDRFASAKDMMESLGVLASPAARVPLLPAREPRVSESSSPLTQSELSSLRGHSTTRTRATVIVMVGLLVVGSSLAATALLRRPQVGAADLRRRDELASADMTAAPTAKTEAVTRSAAPVGTGSTSPPHSAQRPQRPRRRPRAHRPPRLRQRREKTPRDPRRAPARSSGRPRTSGRKAMRCDHRSAARPGVHRAMSLRPACFAKCRKSTSRVISEASWSMQV